MRRATSWSSAGDSFSAGSARGAGGVAALASNANVPNVVRDALNIMQMAVADVVGTDEFLLSSEPYATREAWCHDRLVATRKADRDCITAQRKR